MVAISAMSLPRCGLYRTTRALSPEVPAGVLVNFHNHSERGGPVVHLPVFSTNNRWQWDSEGKPIHDLSDLEGLKPLPAEGYYVVTRDVHFEAAKWPAQSLVQLGYDRKGHAILFLAQRRFHLAENTLFFAERGVPFDHLDALEPLVVHEEPDPNASGGEAPIAT